MSYFYIAVDRLTPVNFRTLDYITVDTSKLYFIWKKLVHFPCIARVSDQFYLIFLKTKKEKDENHAMSTIRPFQYHGAVQRPSPNELTSSAAIYDFFPLNLSSFSFSFCCREVSCSNFAIEVLLISRGIMCRLKF